MDGGTGKACVSDLLRTPNVLAKSEWQTAKSVFMRVFSGVILGYLFFELLWYALFQVTNTDMHAPASISFEAGAVIFGLLFAIAAGFLASFIGGRQHCNAACVAAGLVAVTAVAVMIRKGPAWPQLAALLFMSPGMAVGGYTYVLRRRAQAGDETK